MRYIYRKIAEQLETDLKEKAAFFAEETENNCGCRLFLISLKRRNFDADVAALAGEMLKSGRFILPLSEKRKNTRHIFQNMCLVF